MRRTMASKALNRQGAKRLRFRSAAQPSIAARRNPSSGENRGTQQDPESAAGAAREQKKTRRGGAQKWRPQGRQKAPAREQSRPRSRAADGPRGARRPTQGTDRAGTQQGRPQGSPQRRGWRGRDCGGSERLRSRAAAHKRPSAKAGGRGPGGGEAGGRTREAAAGAPRLSGRSNASASAAGRVPDANGAKSDTGREAQPGQTDPATGAQARIPWVRSAGGAGAMGAGMGSGGCL